MRRRAHPAALSAVLLLAGCGDAGTSVASRPVPEPPASANPSTAASAPGGDLDAFCAAKSSFDAISPDTPDDAAIVAYATAVRGPLERLRENAPLAVRTQAAYLATAVSGLRDQAGGQALATDPRFGEATEAVGVAAHNGCAFTRAEVSATDGRYLAAPTTLPPGATSFRLSSTGTGLHAFVVFRFNDGVTTTTGQLFSGDVGAALAELERQAMFAASLVAQPGHSSATIVTLVPGRYAYFDDENAGQMHGEFVVPGGTSGGINPSPAGPSTGK